MILSEKQQIKFIDWYKSIYGDTSKETWTWKLPEIPDEKQEEHIKMWKEFLKQLLWKDCNKKYTHRWGKTEDYLHLCFNNLYFNYWPVYINKDWSISDRIVWIDDVE